MRQLKIIHHTDRIWHPAYARFVRAVFPSAGFEQWIAWQQWDEDYRAYALVEGETIVANAALMRMRLRLDGQIVSAWQLGAVGVLPTHRGLGLGDQVMQAALAQCGADRLLLFANPKVRQFYPRFGFVPCPDSIFEASFECAPGDSAARVDPNDPQARTQLHRLARDGLPNALGFGAAAHGATVLWHIANGFASAPRQLSATSWVLCAQRGDCLQIDDILTDQAFDLAAAIPRLIDQKIRTIRFGFTPDLWWPSARVIGLDPDADLFVRGFTPSAPQRFPLFART